MAINLIATPYNINSALGAVQRCLTEKKNAAQGITGVSAHSCCCCVIYLDQNQNSQWVVGISRGKIPYTNKTLQQRAACAHGELTAFWDVIEEYNGIPPNILEVYIEMSPCAKCKPALDNILPNGQDVHYSFVHPGQVGLWQAAATNLCK